MLSRWPDQLVGDATVVRRISGQTDLDALSAGWATPDIAASLDDPLASLSSLGPAGYSMAFVEHAAHREAAGLGLSLAIIVRRTGEMAGAITLESDGRSGNWEIGYWTLPGHRGQGHASDAVGMLASWALANGATTIWADAFDRRSAAVLERAGFEPAPTGGDGLALGARRYQRSTPGTAIACGEQPPA